MQQKNKESQTKYTREVRNRLKEDIQQLKEEIKAPGNQMQ